MLPRWSWVFSLYALQKSMIATPCGPSAVPTGGAGVAAPALIWILTTAATFFLAMRELSSPDRLSSPVRLCRAMGRTRVPGGHKRPTSLPGVDRDRQTRGSSELGDLRELELDRRLATEQVDEDLDLELVLVD